MRPRVLMASASASVPDAEPSAVLSEDVVLENSYSVLSVGIASKASSSCGQASFDNGTAKPLRS